MDGAHDARVCGASAKHIRHRLLDLSICRTGIAIEERLGRHDDAINAETALHGLLVDKRFLDGMWFLQCAETFQRRDFGCTDGFDGRHAGTHRLSIYNYGAGTALTQPAAELGSSQGKIVCEDIKQWRAGIHVDRVALSIDPEVVIAHLAAILLPNIHGSHRMTNHIAEDEYSFCCEDFDVPPDKASNGRARPRNSG